MLSKLTTFIDGRNYVCIYRDELKWNRFFYFPPCNVSIPLQVTIYIFDRTAAIGLVSPHLQFAIHFQSDWQSIVNHLLSLLFQCLEYTVVKKHLHAVFIFSRFVKYVISVPINWIRLPKLMGHTEIKKGKGLLMIRIYQLRSVPKFAGEGEQFINMWFKQWMLYVEVRGITPMY